LNADQYVFACGAWLGKLFPDVLGDAIRPTQQDVLFLAVPAGDNSFGAASFPCWTDRTSEEKFYGLPDLQCRGFKIASDLRGPTFDPDCDDRVIRTASIVSVRDFLRRRFPRLSSAPVLETRVCQYENTPDLGFVIDRHPDASNVWLVGGGSGHGYKHGPAIGEYVAGLLEDDVPQLAEFRLQRLRSGMPHRNSSI
jgi:glycine/D-amino acid oxidase-like deaminating enzyme